MVSTRQSSSASSSGTSDAYGGASTSSGNNGGNNLFTGGKLLRSGPVGPAIPPPQQEALVSSFTSQRSLLDMPIEVLEKIFSYLGYKQVAHLRPVGLCQTLEIENLKSFSRFAALWTKYVKVFWIRRSNGSKIKCCTVFKQSNRKCRAESLRVAITH